MLNLMKYFFTLNWDNLMSLFIYFINVAIYNYRFSNIEFFLYFWGKILLDDNVLLF